MVSLTQERFGLTAAPTAAQPQLFAGPDTNDAAAIQAFGNIAGDAHRGFREGELMNDLQETGNIINTINAGTDAIRDAVRKGNIDPTSKRFQSLAAATSQGKISQQRAAIEAEVILRESIAKAPGFADNFRQTAREVLGFDPSSATLGTLFGSGPDASKTKALTQEQKDMQSAEAMFKGGIGDSPTENYNLIQREKAGKLRESITTQQIQDGKLNAGKVAVEGANRATDKMNTIMLGALSQVKSAGGIENPEAFQAALRAAGDQVKSKIENEMSSSEQYKYTPDQYNHVRARVDEQTNAYLEVIESQDLTNMLAKQQQRVAALIDINAAAILPAIAMLKGLPEPLQEAALDMMIMSGGDPTVVAEMMASDPRKAMAGNLQIQLESVAPTITAAAAGNLDQLFSGNRVDKPTAQVVMQDQAVRRADGRPSLDIGELYEGLKATELPKTALDVIAKTAGKSYEELNVVQIGTVKRDFEGATAQQMRTVNQALRNGPLEGLRLVWNNGQFEVGDSRGRKVNDIVFFAPSAFTSPEAEAEYTAQVLASESGAEEALAYINKSLVPIMQDGRWANEMGYNSGQEWAETMINKVNLASLQPEIESGESAIFQSLDIDGQRKFMTAWQNGNLDEVMSTLSNIKASGVGQAQPTGFTPGENLDERRAQEAQAETLPAYQGNPLVPGLTREAQAVAQFEGAHDPADPNWDGKTVGYGLDLDTNPRSADYIKEFELEGKSNQEIAQFFQDNPKAAVDVLNREVQLHKEELIKAVPSVGQLDPVRQETMANLAYNVGVTKLKGFKKMMKAIDDGDFQEARRQLLTTTDKDGNVRLTKWVTQVKAKRAATLALSLQLGRWPNEQEVAQAEQLLQNALDQG